MFLSLLLILLVLKKWLVMVGLFYWLNVFLHFQRCHSLILSITYNPNFWFLKWRVTSFPQFLVFRRIYSIYFLLKVLNFLKYFWSSWLLSPKNIRDINNIFCLALRDICDNCRPFFGCWHFWFRFWGFFIAMRR